MIDNILLELMDSVRMSNDDVEYTIARVQIYDGARFIIEFVDRTFTHVKLYGFDLSKISHEFNEYKSSDDPMFDNVPVEFLREHLNKIDFEYRIFNI